MPETTQPWNLIPYADQPNQDDELLLVIDGENSRRITYEKLIYNQLAEISWVVDPSISRGIGTANSWATIPFNTLGSGAPGWIALNSDGSFTIQPGLYLIEASTIGGYANTVRLRLFDGGNTLLYRHFDSGQGSVLIHGEWQIKKRVSLTESKSLSLQVNVSAVYSNFFYYSFNTLSGLSPTIAQCFIWRLG